MDNCAWIQHSPRDIPGGAGGGGGVEGKLLCQALSEEAIGLFCRVPMVTDVRINYLIRYITLQIELPRISKAYNISASAILQSISSSAMAYTIPDQPIKSRKVGS